ncbi:MAG TPA: 2Fe-2S iron-sulfur cluster-binding protein, partial [Rhodocyclaceae bacterium]|nr:2Fe-2S iron-sulfur cluster-binding protein [Rhodocyclaceae bacterium]
MRSPIPFELDGRPVEALAGESLLQVARRLGIAIPHLCHKEGLRPEGNCRACMVEIEGERVLAASCSRMPAPGMKVRTAGERARAAQRMVLELLRADVPEGCEKPDSELAAWCRVLGVGESRFAPRPAVPADRSHPGIAVDLSACIQCTRCLRACREIQVNDVIGFAGRGAAARIVFDVEAALGSSSCVACGECVQACPTGALMPAAPQSGETAAADAAVRAVDSLCPYCGVGCQVRYEVTGQGADARILRATGRDGPANGGRLCVKGRFGFDYPRHPHRLTRPLIRRPGVAKDM